MNSVIKRCSIFLMAFAIILSFNSTTAFASEITPDKAFSVSALPSKPILGSGSATITGWGMITVNMNNPNQTISEIWVLGNKNGGGANTSASFLNEALVSAPYAKIDGAWHRISNSKIHVSGSSFSFSVDVTDKNCAYNIAIVAY